MLSSNLVLAVVVAVAVAADFVAVAVAADFVVVFAVFVVVVQQQQHSIRRLQPMDNCYIHPTLLGYCDTCRQYRSSRTAWNTWPTDT